MNRRRSHIICLSLFCNLLLVSTISVHAQQTLTDPAEIVGTISNLSDNKIPSIKTSEWTAINLTVKDGYGLPWGFFQSSPKYAFLSNYIWPIVHPKWKPWLGYSSLRFEPEIINGDPRGWYTKITPSAIANADQGKTYNLTLEVKTDDIAVDYAVVVGVKVTRVSPSGEDSGVSYINIPVKASSLNNIKMTAAITTKEIAPHTYGNFEISLTNLGYYRDMFKLEFVKETGITIVTSEQLIVLTPGESQNVKIHVLTQEKFFDIGTPNTLNIYVTSNTDPTPKLIGTIVVITKGIYFSPIIGLVLIPIIIIILIIFIFWFFIKKRREIERFGKPEKPWNIPEEKAYLQDLKQDDKEAYEQERKMMLDEYKSAMLWYQHYRRTLKQQPEEKKPVTKEKFSKKISDILKKLAEKLVKKEKPKKKLPVLLKKSEPKRKKEPVKPIPSVEDTSKEETIAKIKKEQEKQLRRQK